MGYYDKISFYCPVCGGVGISDIDVLGNPTGNTKCKFCNHDLIQTSESYEEIATPENPSWMKPTKSHEEIEEYILEHYVYPNPEYNVDAHERREAAMRKERRRAYQMNRAAAPEPPKATCPRCGSTSISTQKKGFGLGKAAAGVVTIGAAGALAGAAGANKVYNVCQKCGHKWVPGR